MKQYATHIRQYEVKVLEQGPKWTKVRYLDGKEVLTPTYALQYPKITDYSKVKIVKQDGSALNE